MVYPNSVIDGLIKIGGLLAVFQVSLILSYFHEKIFEKRLLEQLEGEELSKQKEGKLEINDVRQIFSTENQIGLIKEIN